MATEKEYAEIQKRFKELEIEIEEAGDNAPFYKQLKWNLEIKALQAKVYAPKPDTYAEETEARRKYLEKYYPERYK